MGYQLLKNKINKIVLWVVNKNMIEAGLTLPNYIQYLDSVLKLK
jgi:hypothetical protein